MRQRISRFLDRLLDFRSLSPPWSSAAYLHRWRLLSLPGGRRVYLHRFLGPDWGRDPHDHSAWFFSFMLWGWYEEQRPVWEFRDFDPAKPGRGARTWETVRYRALWFRWFPARFIHRIDRISPRGCWTLLLRGPDIREWGFWTEDGTWIQWEEYIAGQAPEALR